jgi:hypothetical protein
MTVYKRKSTQPLKWLLGLVVFILAMTLTFADVYGNETVVGGAADNNTTVSSQDNGSTQCPPKPVPEPTTLILLGGGLSAMYLARRKRNKIEQ